MKKPTILEKIQKMAWQAMTTGKTKIEYKSREYLPSAVYLELRDMGYVITERIVKEKIVMTIAWQN